MTPDTQPTMADLLALNPEDFAAAMERFFPRNSPPSIPSSESVMKIAMALAKAQGEFPVIPRDRTVTVKMKDRQTGAPKGEYTFSYAPLSTIREKTRPALAGNGLAVVQAIVLEDDGKGGAVEVLRTVLMHDSGEWLGCDVPMFVGTGDNKAQAYNSGATYARRLGVTLLLCIAADEDDDGNGGEQGEDRPTPDYQRQEQQTYRGSFPKRGGGRSQPQQQNGPRTPQRRQDALPANTPQRTAEEPRAQDAHADDDDAPFQDDPLPSFGLKEFETDASDAAPHGDDGVVTGPWGEGLTPGQLQMAKSRAQVAGLTDAQVLQQVGPITPANVSEKLAALKKLADKALQGADGT